MKAQAEEGYEEEFGYIADACNQLNNISDELMKDLSDNYKGSMPLDVPIKRTLDVMTKTGVQKADTYKATGLKDKVNALETVVSEFEIVSDEEIHAAKLAAADQKRFESDPENKAKIEANAKKNLEERKAREKNKNKITINELEIEENPGRVSKDNDVTKVQGRKSLSSELGKEK